MYNSIVTLTCFLHKTRYSEKKAVTEYEFDCENSKKKLSSKNNDLNFEKDSNDDLNRSEEPSLKFPLSTIPFNGPSGRYGAVLRVNQENRDVWLFGGIGKVNIK